MKTITRRDLLKTMAFAAGGTILLNHPVLSWATQANSSTTKVVLIRNKALFEKGETPDQDVCGQMLDEAICELTGKSNPQEAWSSIIKKGDVLGIKSNEWDDFPTPPEMEQVLKERALQIGIPEEDVSIGDRHVLEDPVFLRSTALINVRPMRIHAWAGVGSLIKNYIMFSDNRAAYHEDSCANLATLHDLPFVKGKSRLHVLVMFTPLFYQNASHHFSREYTWNYSGLLVGFDPVAVDSVGLRIMQAKRNEYFKEDRPLNPPAKHIALADSRYHLGTADPSKIELVKLGWDENSFV